MASFDGDEEWSPLTFRSMPSSIQNHLRQPTVDGTALRAWVVGEFERQVGFSVDLSNSTTSEFALAMKWWSFQLENGDVCFRKYPVLQPLLHGTLTHKVSTLAQRHCYICSGLLPSDRQFPIWVLPIRIEPASRQALDSIDWAAFQNAVRSRFEADHRTYDPTSYLHLCLAFTFVLASSSRDRDVDNMAKALLDAFSRALGFNDKDVHHLDLLKLVDDFPEEYVYIRVAPSHVGGRSDILLPVTNQTWVGQPALRLRDFIPRLPP